MVKKSNLNFKKQIPKKIKTSKSQDSSKNKIIETKELTEIKKYNSERTGNIINKFKKSIKIIDDLTDDGIIVNPQEEKYITISQTQYDQLLNLNNDKTVNLNQKNKETEHNTTKKQTTNEKNTNIQKNKETEHNTTKKQTTNEKNTNIQKNKEIEKKVDAIITELIPNYNKDLSIELEHVDLTFEVDVEKVDTIKETMIRTLKRNKTKKLKIHALKDISLKIYKGEKIGIIGYNGAGKSTLLRVISGIYTPDFGTVKTNGTISPLLSLGAGFDFNYSGRQNILLNGAILGYSKEYLNERMDSIIEFSELGEYIDIPIKNYSSGMLSKLGFAIATSVNPDILIIDEILGVGDVNFKKKSGDKIRSLMDGGTTVIFVSHSIPQVREICDKAIWIDNGKIIEIGEVNKVCDHYLKDAENASNEQLANIQFQ